MYQQVRLEWNSLVFCSVGGLFGMVFGLHVVDPALTPAQKKMGFVSIWFSFAFALFLLNRLHKRTTFTIIPDMKVWKILLLCITGQDFLSLVPLLPHCGGIWELYTILVPDIHFSTIADCHPPFCLSRFRWRCFHLVCRLRVGYLQLQYPDPALQGDRKDGHTHFSGTYFSLRISSAPVGHHALNWKCHMHVRRHPVCETWSRFLADPDGWQHTGWILRARSDVARDIYRCLGICGSLCSCGRDWGSTGFTNRDSLPPAGMCVPSCPCFFTLFVELGVVSHISPWGLRQYCVNLQLLWVQPEITFRVSRSWHSSFTS